ncbi:uncharacterized protein LOC115824766 [Chanos chanos]|uniref:Uncharacterized protein LOC115824766 n=1 Tax=Chanos chanos TaxID=29144 RepID=A0A6J2WJ19_CHACN|nr:uncharacterized protein LOC115824766 [Chanos chanos]
MGWLWLSSCLLLSVWCPVEMMDTEYENDWEWGSGLHELLSNFPADSPFVSESPGRPANCTQRFWLPPSSPVCWDNVAGPEEFAQTRLLVLQNRAALQAVLRASGLEEGGVSYDQQAKEDMQGVKEDHLNVVETTETVQKVFSSLEEKRREGKGHWSFSSLKETLARTKDWMIGRESAAVLLEKQLSSLERSLHTMQLRLAKLLAH